MVIVVDVTELSEYYFEQNYRIAEILRRTAENPGSSQEGLVYHSLGGGGYFTWK